MGIVCVNISRINANRQASNSKPVYLHLLAIMVYMGRDKDHESEATKYSVAFAETVSKR